MTRTNPPLICLILCLVLGGCDSRLRTAAEATPPPAGNEPGTSPALVAESAIPVAATLPEIVSFNEHIQPILSEYCYHCHGPDGGTREPKDSPLRLDREEDAFVIRDTGRPVIIKGKPAESRLIDLVRSPKPDEVMPPPESHKEMGEREIALLERWIEQGAEYEEHWAFAAVKRPDPPAAGDGWAANPIDRFVAEEMERQGLQPNPPEEPRRFHRRLTLDLTGLPPAPRETDAFIASLATNPQAAIEAEAARLLATPAAAEHFARHWLDAVRYGDTHGIHIDNFRNIWPYRDWVIEAFRANMPWDQFTVEQIAGDLLPEPTLDQRIATGYNRCLSTTGEGGAIAAEYLAIYATDRVETTTAVWLGLTASCASCHDHKFDPITMREFYQLAAFFNNSTMSALDGNKASHPPVVFASRIEDRPVIASLETEIAGIRRQLDERATDPAATADFERWLADLPAAGTLPPALAEPALHLPMDETEGPLTGSRAGAPFEIAPAPRREAALGLPAVLASESVMDLGPDLGALEENQSFAVTFAVFVEGSPRGAIVARMDPAAAHRGWDAWLENGAIGFHFIHQWPDQTVKFVAKEPLKVGVWHQVALVRDHTKPPKQAYTLYLNGKPAAVQHSHNNPGGTILAKVPLRLGSRANNDSRLTGGKVLLRDLRILDRPLDASHATALAENGTIAPILALPAASRSPEQTRILRDHFHAAHDPVASEIRQQLADREARLAELRARGSDTLVMDEKPGAEPHAHVFDRGDYTLPGERVTADTPAFLPPMAADEPKNRLGLARWLVDPANPLTARVTVNRTWYYLFGTGIVESTEDFGIMGARPSHPRLLDWLADEFVASGWDYRHLVTLIASSATYRQSARLSPEKLAADPANRFLARGPRIRLDAEPIRDLALAASGLLVPAIGGPPVRPYQPEGLWEAVAMKESNTRFYKQDSGENLYRRSMYTLWKRTAAPATMEIFNAPTRETFCVRRERTNTPLQALALLNDPQFVEACRVLATKAIEASPETAARLDHITLHLLNRHFSADEREVAARSLETMLARYREHPEQAAELLAVGESPAPAAETIDPAELAAWTLVASQILNLDETITR